MKNENGIIDTGEFIDTIVSDVNAAIRHLSTGNLISWCGSMATIAHKLTVLKTGIKNDIAAKNQTIEELKNMIRATGTELQDLTPEQFATECGKEGGVINGSH